MKGVPPRRAFHFFGVDRVQRPERDNRCAAIERPLHSPIMESHHSTTILCVRRDAQVAIAGDGQVTLGNTVAKSDAVKVRRLDDLGAEKKGVLVGFAGAAADAFALLERFEAKLKESPTNLTRAAIELAKLWRSDRALRKLESLLAVADVEKSFMISGQGDVIEPSDGIIAVGSGSTYALAAARALFAHTEFNAERICQEAMNVAADICIYTNAQIRVLTLTR